MQLDLAASLTVLYTGYPCPPHSSSAVYGPDNNEGTGSYKKKVTKKYV